MKMEPKTFNRICAQGDVLIIRLDDAPDLGNVTEVQPEGNHLIVTHSETGHHHVLERESASMFTNNDNELESFLVMHRECNLTHMRAHDTHAPINLPPGNYKVIRQREYTPEGYRRVQD
mgnify:CR=1 FL=1|jgi:hypothetical protein